jgi:hypothetical protein
MQNCVFSSMLSMTVTPLKENGRKNYRNVHQNMPITNPFPQYSFDGINQ